MFGGLLKCEMALHFCQSAAFNVKSQLNNVCLCVINQHFHDIFQQLKIISNMVFTAQLIRANILYHVNPGNPVLPE